MNSLMLTALIIVSLLVIGIIAARALKTKKEAAERSRTSIKRKKIIPVAKEPERKAFKTDAFEQGSSKKFNQVASGENLEEKNEIKKPAPVYQINPPRPF